MKTKPLVFLFVILATFALVAKATDTPPKVTDIYAQTSDLIEAEKYSEAIAFLDKYSIDYRRDPKATVLLARAYLGKCSDL